MSHRVILLRFEDFLGDYFRRFFFISMIFIFNVFSMDLLRDYRMKTPHFEEHGIFSPLSKSRGQNAPSMVTSFLLYILNFWVDYYYWSTKHYIFSAIRWRGHGMDIEENKDDILMQFQYEFEKETCHKFSFSILFWG